jgi:hypothetical protein
MEGLPHKIEQKDTHCSNRLAGGCPLQKQIFSLAGFQGHDISVLALSGDRFSFSDNDMDLRPAFVTRAGSCGASESSDKAPVTFQGEF